MEWRNSAFDWNRARAFLATAEEGSFSAAARALGQSQPTLGRQVAALEEELGVALFERVGHRLVLTSTGSELAQEVRRMNDAAARFSLIAAGQSQSLEGVVRIAASQAVSAYLLPPIIDELRREHPGIKAELVVSNAASDLKRREADIAVRHFRPEGDDLLARLVRKGSRAFFYGAPAYLERIGRPKTKEELAAKAEVFGWDDSELMLNMIQALGIPLTEENIALKSEDHLVQWEMARRGMGLCIMMEEVGDKEPALVRVLPDVAVVTLPTWLISHRELKTNRRIRVTYDLLAERLSEL